MENEVFDDLMQLVLGTFGFLLSVFVCFWLFLFLFFLFSAGRKKKGR